MRRFTETTVPLPPEVPEAAAFSAAVDVAPGEEDFKPHAVPSRPDDVPPVDVSEASRSEANAEEESEHSASRPQELDAANFVLFVSEDHWKIALRRAGTEEFTVIEVGSESTSDQESDSHANLSESRDAAQILTRVSSLLAQLRAYGVMGQVALLAIPSSWCLSASISIQGLPRRHKHQAMLYRLEEHLPIPVEDLTGDFAVHNGRALGVATRTDRLRILVEALEKAGIAVQSICPSSLLAIGTLLHDPPTGALDALLLRTRTHLELFTLRHGQLDTWLLLPDDPRRLLIPLKVLALQQQASPSTSPEGIGIEDSTKGAHEVLPPQANPAASSDPAESIRSPDNTSTAVLHLGACGMDELTVSRLSSVVASTGFEVNALDATDPDLLACRTALKVLQGAIPAPIELRRDALAIKDGYRLVRRPLSTVMVAAALVLAALTATFSYRAYQYHQLAARHDARQVELFRELYPSQSPPLDIRSRLAAEHRRLAALSGQGHELPQRTSALLLLHQALSHLPQDLRYNLTSLRIEPRRLRLDGLARSHGDADALVASLRRIPGLQVDPPHTQASAPIIHQASRGEVRHEVVSFLITATPPEAPPPEVPPEARDVSPAVPPPPTRPASDQPHPKVDPPKDVPAKVAAP